ncbi:hypothetical protein EDB92DRAFT_1818775 [Lactarius akahatsu]|uniref:Dihydrolipoyl dehydrogenase n=1 Tax=Lactarius akahatsu TaxID=416441 RepID=A0AAD4LFD7_9AGAM|nr:hypothetical protein EDB92DRAFT_1818775 [Lactarius akahatsu]
MCYDPGLTLALAPCWPLAAVNTRTSDPSGQYDAAVIGGGPGCYVAAIKAAQLGFKVHSWLCRPFTLSLISFYSTPWSEVAPFPGGAIKIDDQQIVSSTGVLSLQKVPEKAVVIGSGIIGLQMGVWSRQGADVTVVEFLNGTGGVASMRRFHASSRRRLLRAGSRTQQTSCSSPSAIHSQPRPQNVGVKVDARGRIVIDDQFNTNAPNIKCIGDATFGSMLAHKTEEEGIAAVDYFYSGHGHELELGDVKYMVGRFPFLANLRASTNLDTVLGVHIIGPNAGEVIAEGVLALGYGASVENISRTTHAHPTPSEAFREAALQVSSGNAIYF